ncbi:MAG TPA: response regulator [Thermoanaerobaculia bacterium]|nr:response regulator [Thermoanaerobaculia bacterium]
MHADVPRVLLVDDNPLDLELLDAHLSGEGYALDRAGDGLAAFELLEANPSRFDVVLVDRHMPRMGGLELLERLKQNPELKSIPVIVQTASNARSDLLEAMRSGASYYLTKPYDVEMLRIVVRTAARDRASYRQLQAVARHATAATRHLRSARLAVRTLEDARDVGTFLASLCPDPVNAVLGITELLINGIEHGNLGITYDEKSELHAARRWQQELERRLASPEHAAKSVDVTFERNEEEIRITIRDEGTGFDWRCYLEPDPKRVFDTHGRGIVIARRLTFDTLEYRGCGNEVVGCIAVV